MKINLLVLLLFTGFCSSIFLPNSKWDDKIHCQLNADIDSCKSFPLTTNDLECCQFTKKIKYTNTEESGKNCDVTTYPINRMKEYYNTKQGQANFKEEMGYELRDRDYLGQISEVELNIDCQDGAFQIKSIGSGFNSDEVSILKSDEHCLKYHDTEGDATEDICLESKLMKHSINVGLTCGYYEYHFHYNDGTNFTKRLCGIFDRNIYNTKKIDMYSIEMIESALYSYDYESFDVHITGVKNKTLIYYSSNNSVIYDGPGEEIVPIYPESSSRFLSKKNLLFFCFLLLF